MDSVSGVGVLDKAVGVMRALRTDGAMGLAELQQATGLPRATAHRLAVALEQHGLVRRDSAGRFCLGFELIALGRAAAEAYPLGELARPALLRLRDATGESVQLFVREGDERRCVVSLQSPHGLRWIVPEGARLPLAVGSAGRILSGDDTDRAQRWVESVEEREPGVASVSAAVVSSVVSSVASSVGSSVGSPRGAVIAAVSISGPIERLSRQPGDRFGAAVVGCAAELTAALATSSL